MNTKNDSKTIKLNSGNKTKHLIKTISAFLAIIFCLQVIPALSYKIFAADLGMIKPGTDNGDEIREIATVLYEDESKRGESEKHFIMSDGTITAVINSQPVHFLTSDGKWSDIDNTLKFEEAKESDENDFDGYVNTASDFKIKIAKNLSDGILFKVGSEEASLTFGVDEKDLNKDAVVSITEKEIEETESITRYFSKLTSEAEYKDAICGADISYTLDSKQIKERIIVENRADEYEYSFIMRSDELYPDLNDDGSVSLISYSDGTEKYYIPAPIMYDADGNYSDAVTYEVNEREDGAYSFKLIADAEWVNDEETVFPVTIDPTIRVSTNYYAITDSFVTTSSPDTVFDHRPNVSASHNNNSTSRILFAVNSLPSISSTDTIISAIVHYEPLYGTYNKPYFAYNIVDSVWYTDTVTWNNQPQAESEPLDYSKNLTNTANAHSGIELNITRALKSWYTDGKQRHGIMIKTDEVQNYGATFLSSWGSSNSSFLMLSYRSNGGIDSALSYTTVDAGESGTVYVNNQTGVVYLTRDDISSIGQTFPFSISHIYSTEKFNYFVYRYMNAGFNWKLNIQQLVLAYTGEYVYIDSTGDEHYLVECDGEYIDEDGSGMKLSVDTNNQNILIITYPDDSEKRFQRLFQQIYYMISETDADGNTISYTYDNSKRISSVTDADGESALLSYNNDNYLTSVSYNGRTLSYTYDTNGSLISVYDSLVGATVSSYTYDPDSTHYKMTSMTDRSGMTATLNYTDPDSTLPFNTSSLKWKYSATGIENGAEFSYNGGNSTTVLYYGLDAVKNTADDIRTTYVFDYCGRPINIYNEDAEGVVLGVNITGYNGTTALNGKNGNISRIASVGVQNENLIDGSFIESDNTVDASVSTDEFYIGNSSTEVEITSASGNAGVVRQMTLPAGTYTFSAYVKAPVSVTEKLGVWVKDQIDNDLASAFNIKGTNSDLDNGWERLYVTFDLQSSATVTLGVGVDSGSGTIYVDAIKLERSNGFAPSAYNMLIDPGFENNTSPWSGNGTVSSADEKSGTYSLSIAGDISTVKKESQTVSLGYIPENSYVVSGWAKASSAMIQDSSFGLEATVTYEALGSDSVTYTGLTKTTEIPFSKETTAWQYISGIVEMPQTFVDDNITYYVKKINSITVSAVYSNNVNTAYFDDISLVQSSAVMIDYDGNGNISSFTVDNEESNDYVYEADSDKLLFIKKKDGTVVEEYVYDNDDNLIQVKDENAVVIRSYTYDANGNMLTATEDGETTTYTYINDLISSVTASGVTTSYTYDANDRQTGTSRTATIGNTSYTLIDSASVLNSLGLVTSETDSRGKSVSYTYDSNNRTTSVIDAEGNVTRYTYTTTGDLACEFVDADNDGVLDTGESYVSYTYDTLGRATGIDANGMAYSLTYNEAGLPYQIKVGTTAIATYTYTGDYTKRASVAYANGLTENYIYDILGNVKEYRRNSTSVCTYDYDGNGNLIRKNDVGSGKITEYLYNALGEQLASRVINSSNELLIYSAERTDAVNDDITYTDTKYVLGGVEITYTTQYDSSDDTSKYILPTTAEISSEQDIFGRLSSRYIKDSNDNDILTYTYSYEGRTDNNVDYTSNAVSSVTLSSGISYSYTYDDNGNITGVTTAADPYSDAGDYVSYSTGPLLTTYEYDDLGELVRENNPIADKTWTYSYDGNGNILSKSEYAYTTGTLPSTPQSTKTYAYGNSVWGDQLTNYDSQTISYDAQGNPLNWKNGETLTWSGRRLESWDDGQHTYTFTYDENGNRTKTAVGTSVNEYVYDDDGKIIQNGTVTYYYDEDGCPVALKNGNYLFYYQFNEQGDVTGLIDSSGNLVLINEYDAWGNDLGGEYTASRARAAWKKNIYRYRGKYGYVYDKNLDLYYLKTRFYDPEVGRFLNEDDPDYLCASGTTLGGNLYAYCENDSINCIDIIGKYTSKSLRNLSFLFKLASLFGINLDITPNRMQERTVININLWLIKLRISITVGLVKNYRAGMAFSLSKNGVAVSCNLGLGVGYSLAYSLNVGWFNLSRSMSLVYSAKNDGVYVSLNVEFQINHLLTVAAIAACYFVPQFIPVLWQLVSRSATAAVSSIGILVPILRHAYGV